MQIEKELWARIGNNDQEAYAAVFRFYYRRFFNYGRKFSGDEPLVEDAVQETLLLIWDRRHTLISIGNPATYFYTAFRHLLFQKIKQARQVVLGSPAEEEPDFSVEHFIIARETSAALNEQLKQALGTLTPRQREAIFLRFYEDLSYDEVAAVLNITTKATYKIMARALAQLKEAIRFLILFFPLLVPIFFK